MALRPLADLLWEAANERLSPNYCEEPTGTDAFSCNAVGMAYAALLGQRGYVRPPHEITFFLQSLGCTGSASQIGDISGIDRIREPEAIQGVRYMWLLLAMHVAEDEGITV